MKEQPGSGIKKQVIKKTGVKCSSSRKRKQKDGRVKRRFHTSKIRLGGEVGRG